MVVSLESFSESLPYFVSPNDVLGKLYRLQVVWYNGRSIESNLLSFFLFFKVYLCCYYYFSLNLNVLCSGFLKQVRLLRCIICVAYTTGRWHLKRGCEENILVGSAATITHKCLCCVFRVMVAALRFLPGWIHTNWPDTIVYGNILLGYLVHA